MTGSGDDVDVKVGTQAAHERGRTVVFPQPEGPIRAVISFSRTGSVTSRTARNAP